MNTLDFDLIYNIEKLENKEIKKEEKNNKEIEEKDHKCNYLYDIDTGYYVCKICGEVNNEMNKYIDDIDTEKVNSYHPIDQVDYIKVKGIKNYQLNQKAAFIYSNVDYEKKETFKMMNEITQHCNLLGIQKNISDDAQLIYQNVIKTILNDKTNKFIKGRGRNNEGLKGACIYYACLKNNLCITISKISESMNNLKQTYIHNECSIIQKLLKMYPKLRQFIPITCFYYPVSYLNTMIKCFNLINLTDINNIKKMLLYLQYDDLIPNHNPLTISIAVCLVYLVYKGYMKPNFAKKDVAKYFGISQPTISASYKELQSKKSIILNYCLNHTEQELITELNIKTTINLNNEILNKLNNKMNIIENNNLNIDLDYIKSLN